MDYPLVPRFQFPIMIREIGPFDAECSSVGVVVRAPFGKILLLDRLKGIYGGKDSPHADFDPGLGWACPAGHIEENEHPFEAGIRELREETGITKLQSAAIVLELVASNPCRKAKNHHWYIMQVEVDQELGSVMEPTKHGDLIWVNPFGGLWRPYWEPVWLAILGLMRQKGML